MEPMCVEQIERNHLLSLPRLLNNRMLELRQQFLSSRPKKNRGEVMNLRQNLFGRNDSKENLSFAQEELSKASKAFNQRWDFDVDAGKPTEGSYQWELIQESTKQALDTSGRLTCLTTLSSASNAKSSSPKATSPIVLPSTSSSSSTTTRSAVTTTTFSTTTTPTAVVSKKCVKRLQKSVSNKVPKLITDYFKDSKSTAVKSKGKDANEEKDSSVSSRVVEILKIRSLNVR